MSKIFKHSDSVIMIDGDKEFSFFFQSNTYKVRRLSTGEPAGFTVNELLSFMDIIKADLVFKLKGGE